MFLVSHRDIFLIVLYLLLQFFLSILRQNAEHSRKKLLPSKGLSGQESALALACKDLTMDPRSKGRPARTDLNISPNRSMSPTHFRNRDPGSMENKKVPQLWNTNSNNLGGQDFAKACKD